MFTKMQTPVGEMILVANEKGLSAVMWPRDGKVPVETGEEDESCPVLKEAVKQIEEYFRRERRTFSLPLDIHGTAFQVKVWNALLTIPFGETRTYGQIAKQIGATDAARAIGSAVHNNPLSIVIPCHRVIGANGKLVGFGGGLQNKSILLRLEAVQTPELW
jgi:methylated-DNA-[protein]-cysteine S-methyltransferase